ncbi:hypothetical protein [Pyrococcus kukulkanii]|uniref:Uncharacterized protein n=1 Tax=Pyrococcus kukulkanii TaxID=1609559 RepID=A0ABV4T7Y4_9EURY
MKDFEYVEKVVERFKKDTEEVTKDSKLYAVMTYWDSTKVIDYDEVIMLKEQEYMKILTQAFENIDIKAISEKSMKIQVYKRFTEVGIINEPHTIEIIPQEDSIVVKGEKGEITVKRLPPKVAGMFV